MTKLRAVGITLAVLLVLSVTPMPALTATDTPTPLSSVEGDRAALVAPYDATGGANWKSDKPLGEWHGITTNAAGRVTGIVLDRNRLAGTIPTELANLTELEELNLFINGLTGVIPTELTTLSNLRELQLHSNDLTDVIPTELATLSNLEELDLGYNDLTGTIPPELGNLAKLRDLSLYANDLTGAFHRN